MQSVGAMHADGDVVVRLATTAVLAEGIGTDGQLVQPLTEYVPMQVRPLTDTLTVTVDPPFEHVGVAVEPSGKVMVEPKEDAVPAAQEHPECHSGKSVMAPEAEVVMV